MKAKKWWQKVPWEILSCIVPGIGAVLCFYAFVEAAIANEFIQGVYLFTALSVNVFAFVAIWTFTVRK